MHGENPGVDIKKEGVSPPCEIDFFKRHKFASTRLTNKCNT